MIFLFPKKKIVLDCFTYSKSVIETAPIENAMKHTPEWWKKLPNVYYKNIFPNPTMKSCAGMIDYYVNSVALPLWSDLLIDVDINKSYKWQFSDRLSEATVHDLEQNVGFLNNHGHLKLITPWLLKTKRDVKWLWTQPIYNFNLDIANINVPPGILNFNNQCGVNVNMLIPLDQAKKYLIPQGQVLGHLTPLSEYKFKVVRHLIEKSKFAKIYDEQTAITFVNKYKNIIKQKQKFSDCPYKKD